MHEMALAEGIVDVALDAAKENGGGKVLEVGLKIGDMTGVETEALNTAFHILTRETLLKDAALKIERMPLIVRCDSCDEEREQSVYNFFCKKCGGVLKLVSGRELQVAYINMEDNA
ncbi:MAG: hydrogenase maturation nickel metallochaperone HypA [Selenomonadaceae bacterium]|nr:hydrogenase maturation nickel metallochaperone HypA [Selenomonadaceae bacterium]